MAGRFDARSGKVAAGVATVISLLFVILTLGVCGVVICVGFLVVWVMNLDRSTHSVSITIAVVGAAGALALCGAFLLYVRCATRALCSMRARLVTELQQPQLYRLVRDVWNRSQLPMPAVYLSPTASPNMLTTSRGPAQSAVCVTSGLLTALTDDELRAVLAHGLAQVKRGDATKNAITGSLASLVAGVADMTSLFGFIPRRTHCDGPDEATVGVHDALLLGVCGPVASVVVRLTSPPGRVFETDQLAAELSGNPVALACALAKLERGARCRPLPQFSDVAANAHAMVVHPFPPSSTLGRIFLTHPPTDERIARLEGLVRN